MNFRWIVSEAITGNIPRVHVSAGHNGDPVIVRQTAADEWRVESSEGYSWHGTEGEAVVEGEKLALSR